MSELGWSKLTTTPSGSCRLPAYPSLQTSSRHLTSPLTVASDLGKRWLAWRLPPTRSHGGSRGFKSRHLHPYIGRSERRQRRAGGAHCMSRPRRGRKLRSQSSREALSDARGLGPRPHHDHPAWSPPAADRRAILARIPPLLVGHPVDQAHCPTAAHDDDQVEADPPLAQHELRQPPGPAPTSGRRGAVMDPAATPTPAIPAVWAAGPPPRQRGLPHPRRRPRASGSHACCRASRSSVRQSWTTTARWTPDQAWTRRVSSASSRLKRSGSSRCGA